MTGPLQLMDEEGKKDLNLCVFTHEKHLVESLSISTVAYVFMLAPVNTKLFHAQLSMKFIPLINVKMSTIVGISTFISRINTISESKSIFQHFSFYE